jgi:hypothetical protein
VNILTRIKCKSYEGGLETQRVMGPESAIQEKQRRIKGGHGRAGGRAGMAVGLCQPGWAWLLADASLIATLVGTIYLACFMQVLHLYRPGVKEDTPGSLVVSITMSCHVINQRRAVLYFTNTGFKQIHAIGSARGSQPR